MKTLRKRAASPLLLIALCGITVFAQSPSADDMPRLTNNDILGMVQAGISSEVIIAKIKISRCNFDTDPTILAELKHHGVSNELLKAMVEAPYGPPKTHVSKPTNATVSVMTAPAQPREETTSSPNPSEPEYGSVQDMKDLRKVFVRSTDDDSRSTIMRLLAGYEGVEIVNSPKVAEIILDYTILTRDVAANRGPYAQGASMALKSEMRAFVTKPDGTRVIAWTETETFDVTNGFSLGAPNEVNLTTPLCPSSAKGAW
jgi:hypothetical protein